MNLYQILLPSKTNAGEGYQQAHTWWKESAMDVAGAFTKANAVQGMWIDSEQWYGEILTPYYVACTPEQWRILVNKAFELFSDQKAIFHALIGDATIEFRCANEVAV